MINVLQDQAWPGWIFHSLAASLHVREQQGVPTLTSVATNQSSQE